MTQLSPITNCYDPAAVRAKLDVERVMLYQPETDWTYSHHPHLAAFGGRLYAIWSNGRRDEDAPEQRVLLASSANGRAWTAPEPLLDSQPGEFAPAVLTAAGFHQHQGTLVAYVGSYEYRQSALTADGVRYGGDHGHQRTRLLALTSRDGQTWTAPRELGLPVVPNHGPQRTASGRLIICGNISYPWTDDPAGLDGWTMAGLYPPDWAATIVDDSASFAALKDRLGWPVALCEGSFYQTDDHVLHLLLRSGSDRLWASESHDDGATWTGPLRTEFTDNVTKFHFGRLPDGRFYYVGCPDPASRWQRNPLVLSLSVDGIRFDRHWVVADEPYAARRPGLYKGGEYGYPHTLLHTGRLYVIVSRQKEGVEVLHLPLAALA